MLRNFFNTLDRFRMASFLNVIGLTVAYIAVIIVGLQVMTEYSHDKMYPDYDRIYQVQRAHFRDQGLWRTTLSRPIIDAIVTSSPEIEESAIIRFGYSSRDYNYNNQPLWRAEGKTEDDKLIRNRIGFISVEFSEMFGMKIISGEALSDDPQKVIIPRSQAEEYFGAESPLGKVLISNYPGYAKVTVSGVYEDFPPTSSFANMFYRNATDDQAGLYGYMNYDLFVKLRSSVDTAVFNEKLNRVANEAGRLAGVDDIKLRVLPLTEAYFAVDISTYNTHVVNDESKIRLFGMMAILIIFIAGINYINFAMALVPLRIRSINTRKIFGANTQQLRLQLVVEAVGISIIAYLIAVGVLINFDTLNVISFIPTQVNIADNLIYFVYLGLLAVGLGVVAGLYPAFYSTAFPAALVLKGSFSLSPKGRALRTVLVGFQFVISIGLIIASMFMNAQFSMIRNADLGVDKENVLQLRVEDKLNKKIGELKTAVAGIAGVRDITFTPYNVISDQYSTYAFGSEELLVINNIHGTSNIIDFFGFRIIDGRNFTTDDDLKAPNSVVIINRTAQKHYNLGVGDLLGDLSSIYDGYNLTQDQPSAWQVIGVVEDFNFKPLYEPIAPLIIANYGTAVNIYGKNTMYIKVQTNDYSGVIEKITAAAKELDPDWVSDLSFVDDHLEQLYKEDVRSASLIGWFSFLAILISLSGVFGLVRFEIGHRRREIGLRKINGATIREILAMLSRKFILMTLVCYVVATPIAIYFVNDWLKTFTYRTPLHWWIFALSLAIILTLILVTVIVQSYRTARENPINSIKTE